VIDMKRKVRNFLEQNKLLPITVFSSTEPSELKTGYSDPSKFSLDMVMIYKDEHFHVFSRGEDQQYVVQEQRIKAHHISALKDFTDGMTLCGYDLNFTTQLLDLNLRTNETEKPFTEMDSIDISKTLRGFTGQRYKLFDLAFWNACEDMSRLSEVFQLHQIKIITDWFNGSRRNIIRKMRTNVKWISQLTYRMQKHKSIIVKDENGDRKKLSLMAEEE
jgi:hypothetical protein